MAGCLVLFIGGSLFLSYILKVSSTFQPTKRIDIPHAPKLQEEQSAAAKKAEEQKEKFMEDYKYKLEKYKQDRRLWQKY